MAPSSVLHTPPWWLPHIVLACCQVAFTGMHSARLPPLTPGPCDAPSALVLAQARTESRFKCVCDACVSAHAASPA
jgi:hypothetical protein